MSDPLGPKHGTKGPVTAPSIQPTEVEGNSGRHKIKQASRAKRYLHKLVPEGFRKKKITERSSTPLIEDKPNSLLIGFDYTTADNNQPRFTPTGTTLDLLNKQLSSSASSKEEIQYDKNHLAAGTNGYIDAAQYNGRDVAVKRLYSPDHASRITRSLPPQFVGGQEMIREARILDWLQIQPEYPEKQDHIVELVGSGMVMDEPVLLLALAKRGSLASTLKQSSDMDSETIARLTTHLGKGLSLLHHLDIIHQDIKPENLLIDEYGRLQICDFGEATGTRSIAAYDAVMKYNPMEPGGTISLRPGANMFEPVGTHSDVWAAGRVVATLILGREQGEDFCQALNALEEFQKPVDQLSKAEMTSLRSQIHQLIDLYISISALPDESRESFNLMLKSCLEPDYRKRGTAIQLQNQAQALVKN